MAKMSDYIKPTPKQSELLSYIGLGYYIFFGGARGGGKSHGAMVGAIRAAKANPGLVSVIIRSTYQELVDNFISKIEILFPPEIFGYTYHQTYRELRFKNGSKILFRSCDDEKKVKKIQGIEYQLIIIDEAPNLQWSIIDRITGSLRRSKSRCKDFIPTLVMTGNPGGISDYDFKIRYIKPDYSLWTESELRRKDKMIFISSNVYDNEHLGEEYVETLMSISDPNLRKAWLEGNWDIFEGQFFTSWNEKVHVVEPFPIPKNWFRFAGFDLGYTEKHPSVWVEFAYDQDTNTIYGVNEYSGYGGVEANIREIKRILDGREVVTFADPSIWNSSTKKTDGESSPGMMFSSAGLAFIPAINDRVNGWRNLKEWLNWNETTPPQFKLFDTLKGCIKEFPRQRYASLHTGSSKEDLDTKAVGDDYVDAIRYAVYSSRLRPNIIMQGINIKETNTNQEVDNMIEECSSDFIYDRDYNFGINIYSRY